MKKCFICNKEADKKGSHIVPHFLMKRIDNEEGTNARDKELGFEITESGSTSYFGKAVLPEKLEEIYGEVTDELIENNKNGGIVDHYFCSDCEKKLGIIESEYSQILKIDVEELSNYISFDNGFISFLFWLSIAFRLSIQKESDFQLKPKDEKKLRRILFKYLNLDKKKIEPDLSDSDLSGMSYKLLRSPNYSLERGTFLTNIPSYSQPYSLMIGEFILFIYFKNTHIKGMTQDFYGSQKFKENAELNNAFSKEHSYAIKDTELKNIINQFIKRGNSLRLNDFNLKLDFLYGRILGHRQKMPDRIKKEILEKVFNNNDKLGIRDTPEQQIKIVREVLEKYHT